MPELPEVEAARRAVQEHCCGKRIVRSIVADDPKVVDGVSPSDFQRSLDGKTIVGAHRKGKNMWLQLDSPPFPSFQFGMSGAIYIKGVAVTKYKRSAVQDTDEWPSKYSKVFIELDDGLEFSFTDKRRFAKVRLLQDPASVHPISELGRDALFDPMSAEEFADSLSKKKIAIKPLLLDQAFIAGIGNWMADEVLYQARIHPLRIASSLSKEESELLHNSIKEVIRFAVQVDADGNRFPSEWMFHFRWGKKPGHLNGKKIEFITAGGRTTAYVPELQKLAEALPETEKGRNKRVVKSNRKEKSQTNEEEGNDEEGASSPAKRKKKQMSSAKEHKGGQKKVAKGDKGNQADKLTKSRKVAKKITKKGVKRSGKIDFDR